MATVAIASQAGRDTRAILRDLVDQGGFARAQDFAAAIVGLQNRLGTFPRAYSTRPSLGEQIRLAVIAPYVVLYRYDEISDHVLLLRVVHGRRHITDALLKRQ